MQRLILGGFWIAVLCVISCEMWAVVAWGQDPNVAERIPQRPRPASESIPAPPCQADTWKAPETKLSNEFVSATATLFEQGLADPRGCEYREIEVRVGCWGAVPTHGVVLKTHGWVIDSGETPPRLFGVCWNGLVYPLISVGEPADLYTDAAAAAKAEATSVPYNFYEGYPAYCEDECICNPSEIRSVLPESPLPMKACLLLRLGEAALAERLWSHWTSAALAGPAYVRGRPKTTDTVEANQVMLRDPYLVLANCWTLALYERALGAHSRGDDDLALASCETLISKWPAVKAEAEKRGFRKSLESSSQFPTYFLLDVDHACKLLSDQRRRAEGRKRGASPPVLVRDHRAPEEFTEAMSKELEQCPDKAQRIALMVRELEEASPDSGSAQLLIMLLIEQGEAAVEPLLACLETDPRLSRARGLHNRFPLGVHAIAKQALAGILKIELWKLDEDDTRGDEAATRRADATKIREHWKRSCPSGKPGAMSSRPR